MNDRYTDTYYAQARSHYGLKRRLRALLRTWLHPRALKRLVERLPEGARVLDVGCGTGDFLHRLHELRPDLELWGVDFTAAAPRDGFTFVCADVARLPFPDGSFDLALSKQVLEHLHSPDAHIGEAFRVLRPGASLYLDCPDARGASSWAVPNFWDDPTHVRPYTRRALRRLLGLHGFSVPAAGRVRDWRVILLGPAYLPVAWLARDAQFLPGWLRHLLGLWIYAVGRKLPTAGA